MADPSVMRFTNVMAKRPIRSGFTLVELLIVAVVLAIFAAIVVPNMLGADREAQISATQTALGALQKQLDVQNARNGQYPQTIDIAWFQGFQLPKNPLVTDPAIASVIRVSQSNDPNKWHVANKVRDDRAYWYNPANGTVRAMIPTRFSEEALDLYNTVNGTNITSINQTGK